MTKLDIDAVHAFVLVADLHSFTRAGEAMDSTQSAVSLKIRRLEEGLGRRLLERTPRRVRLSADGEAFLGSARALVDAHRQAVHAFAEPRRRLVIGISHHLVGAELAQILRRIQEAERGVVVEMRVSTSRDVFEAFERGAVDVAVVIRNDNRRLDGEVIFEVPFCWMAAPDFVHHSGEPIPLAMQGETCVVRRMAVGALDAAGMAWREAFVGGGMLTIAAAAAAGLGVAALARRVAPADLVDVGRRFGLPVLPAREAVLLTSVTDTQARGALRALSAALNGTAI
jgi:DNA-binding transcriptional LysR family regulator